MLVRSLKLVLFVWQTHQNFSYLLMISLRIVSVIPHLVRSVLVHLVQILISIGIQNQSFLFAVSNATRLSRRRWWLKLPVDVVNDPLSLASSSYMEPSMFLSFTEALVKQLCVERLVESSYCGLCICFIILFF